MRRIKDVDLALANFYDLFSLNPIHYDNEYSDLVALMDFIWVQFMSYFGDTPRIT